MRLKPTCVNVILKDSDVIEFDLDMPRRIQIVFDACHYKKYLERRLNDEYSRAERLHLQERLDWENASCGRKFCPLCYEQNLSHLSIREDVCALCFTCSVAFLTSSFVTPIPGCGACPEGYALSLHAKVCFVSCMTGEAWCATKFAFYNNHNRRQRANLSPLAREALNEAHRIENELEALNTNQGL